MALSVSLTISSILCVLFLIFYRRLQFIVAKSTYPNLYTRQKNGAQKRISVGSGGHNVIDESPKTSKGVPQQANDNWYTECYGLLRIAIPTFIRQIMISCCDALRIIVVGMIATGKQRLVSFAAVSNGLMFHNVTALSVGFAITQVLATFSAQNEGREKNQRLNRNGSDHSKQAREESRYSRDPDKPSDTVKQLTSADSRTESEVLENDQEEPEGTTDEDENETIGADTIDDKTDETKTYFSTPTYLHACGVCCAVFLVYSVLTAIFSREILGFLLGMDRHSPGLKGKESRQFLDEFFTYPIIGVCCIPFALVRFAIQSTLDGHGEWKPGLAMEVTSFLANAVCLAFLLWYFQREGVQSEEKARILNDEEFDSVLLGNQESVPKGISFRRRGLFEAIPQMANAPAVVPDGAHSTVPDSTQGLLYGDCPWLSTTALVTYSYVAQTLAAFFVSVFWVIFKGWQTRVWKNKSKTLQNITELRNVEDIKARRVEDLDATPSARDMKLSTKLGTKMGYLSVQQFSRRSSRTFSETVALSETVGATNDEVTTGTPSRRCGSHIKDTSPTKPSFAQSSFIQCLIQYLYLCPGAICAVCVEWWSQESMAILAGRVRFSEDSADHISPDMEVTIRTRYLDAQSIIFNATLQFYMAWIGVSVAMASRIGQLKGEFEEFYDRYRKALAVEKNGGSPRKSIRVSSRKSPKKDRSTGNETSQEHAESHTQEEICSENQKSRELQAEVGYTIRMMLQSLWIGMVLSAFVAALLIALALACRDEISELFLPAQTRTKKPLTHVAHKVTTPTTHNEHDVGAGARGSNTIYIQKTDEHAEVIRLFNRTWAASLACLISYGLMFTLTGAMRGLGMQKQIGSYMLVFFPLFIGLGAYMGTSHFWGLLGLWHGLNVTMWFCNLGFLHAYVQEIGKLKEKADLNSSSSKYVQAPE